MKTSACRRTAQSLRPVLFVVGVTIAASAWGDTVDVVLSGVDDPLVTNARKSLSLTAPHDKAWDADHIKRLYRLAPAQIRKALQPYGYFNPQVKSSLKSPAGDSDTWHAQFEIRHGPATHIAQLRLNATGPGADTPAIQRAMAGTALKKGDRLVQSRYSATKSALQQAAYTSGYLTAAFSHSVIRVRPKANSADIDLVLATGPRYYFGHIDFEQNVINDRLARRFVAFSPGEPFSDDRLVQLQLDLSKTNYFSQVNIDAKRSQPTRHQTLAPWFHDLVFPDAPKAPIAGELWVPIVVKAEPSKFASYSISGGYGTDTGPRVGLGLDLRHINKRGHSFHADLQLSQIKQRLHASYDIPIKNVRTDKLSFTGSVANEDFGDITSFRYGVGVVRDIGWQYGRRRLGLHVLRSRYDLHDGAGTRTANILYPSYAWTFRRADKSLNPHKGVSVTLDGRAGPAVLPSSTNFGRINAKAAAIYPLTSWIDGVVRGEFGAIAADDFQNLPPSQRFFAGGEHSVRGYGYQSISPTNGDRVDVGGKFLSVASIEADYWVYGNFGFATFFDIGDAANSMKFDYKKSVGVGFRWASPVGMVAFDVSHPLDGKHGPVGIGISIGPKL